MKKYIIAILFILLGMPALAASTSDKVLKSELGIVEKITYEDVEQNYSDKSQVQQIVTVKILTG